MASFVGIDSEVLTSNGGAAMMDRGNGEWTDQRTQAEEIWQPACF